MRNRTSLWGTRFFVVATISLLLVLAQALGSGAVFAEQNEFPNGLLDLSKTIEAAREVTTERHPNADQVLVDDHILARYEKDGTSVEWDDTFVKVLTEKGRRENSSLSFNFTLPYETRKLLLLQVIKPDGRVLPVDVEAQIRVMIDPSQMGSNIYNPNSKVLQAGVPGLEIGDMVRYVSFAETTKARVPSTWSDYQIFEYTSPIRRYTYEVHAPKELPLRSIVMKDEVENTVTHTKTETKDRIIYKWEARDVPQIFTEPNMPAFYTVVHRLLVSTIPDWKDISKWYWSVSEPRYATDQAIRDKVRELVGATTDPMEKINVLFRWVSQEIRYMGITVEAEAPGYEPHDVTLTFHNRHGVCRDKAALLVVMLREAGLKAYPVIIHNGPKKDEEVPQPYFNHAVVAVQLVEDEYVLMDPTDENTKELFPAYLCNQSYLVARPDGDRLRVSPIVPASENMMLIETTARLAANGKLSGESLLSFHGINDNAYRGHFSGIKPEERRKFFDGVIKRVVAGGRLTELKISPENLQDTTAPLSVMLRFEADDVLVSGSEAVMLPLPSMGADVGIVNFILGRLGLEKRKYPLQTDIACGVEEKLTLTVDPGVGELITLPSHPVIDTPTLGWRRDVGMEGRVIKSQGEFLLKGVEFSPQEYLELKSALKDLEYEARKTPIFRPGVAHPTTSTEPDVEQPDVEFLETIYDYVIHDAHNWEVETSVRKHILSYKGRRDNSELKFTFNPAWENVELTTASVVSGDKTLYISPEEINTMDEGWVGSAPRYPAAKTMVVSLPGVQEGCEIFYQYKQTFRDRPFFSMSSTFRGREPVGRSVVRISAPKNLKLSINKSGGAEFSVGEASPESGQPFLGEKSFPLGERRIYEWTALNQPAVPTEDTPPPWWSFNPTVFVSAGDWDVYASQVEGALKEAAAERDEAGAKALEIVREISGRRQRVVALRDFVARNIRPAGPGLTQLPFSAISPADLVLREGYGNSTDRGVLLYAMLRAIGEKPVFVLGSFGPADTELTKELLRSPDPSLHGDLLIRLKMNGEWIYLNDTNQYDALGSTPHESRPGLLLEKPFWAAFRNRLVRIEAAEGLENRSELEFDIELMDNGDARVKRTKRYFGGDFGAGRNRFTEINPEERSRYFQEAVAEISQSAKAEGDLVTDFTSYPGVETFTVLVERFAVVDNEHMNLNLPHGFGNALRLRADSRTIPLYWQGRQRAQVAVMLHLPERWREVLLAPEEREWEAPKGLGEIRVEVEKTDDLIRVEHEMRLKPGVIDTEDYSDLLEINRRLSHPAARAVLLRKTP
jgi:transglutaminase-like putative cysteine protease